MNENEADRGRHYKCARCGKAVLICTCCDRGNRYCSDGCQECARAESQRKSAKLYWRSKKGKANASARQVRFRMRRQEKVIHLDIPPQQEEQSPHVPAPICAPEKIVTQHGSPPQTQDASMPPVQTVVPIADHKPFCCHFCDRLLSEFVRTNKLAHRIRHPVPLYMLHDRRKQHHDHDP